MTETTDTTGSSGEAPTSAATSSARGRKDGIEGMLLPQLKQLAGGLGIKTTGMRKGAVIEAIKAHQESQGTPRAARTTPPATGSAPAAEPAAPADRSDRSDRSDRPDQSSGGDPSSGADQGPRTSRRARARAERPAGPPTEGRSPEGEPDQRPQQDRSAQQDQGEGRPSEGRQQGARDQDRQGKQDRQQDRQTKQDRQQGKQQDGQQDGQRDAQRDGQRDAQRDGQDRQGKQDRQQGQNRQNNDRQQDRQNNDRQQDRQNNDRQNDRQNDRGDDTDDDEGGSRRNRRRRGRDRQGTAPQSGARGHRNEPDLQILEDDVLAPCAGILDLMDNYAFVRTSGYLPGADDVYVSMSMVRRYGLRRGDAVTGQVRQPREGERREKFNPLVRLDSVNGADPETARSRVEFAKLTPLHPSERLRLETGPTDLVGRAIDLAAPIGKGQRGLLVSPPRAGRTAVLQSLAHSVTTNNPECHLMVVLVDERPEEVTDFQRSVKGEVVGSTFDRPPSDHTIVAELALERAKRLVELGHDVVLLLDGLTRLGRAYALATPATGRVLPGGVDSASLHPPKRFFGAARNVENGGSLTIVATALVESGSEMDEVILEDFAGTSNMELRLRGDVPDQRLFPSVDLARSGTRHDDQLRSPHESAAVGGLRRALADLGDAEAAGELLARLRATQDNAELLRQLSRATPAT